MKARGHAWTVVFLVTLLIAFCFQTSALINPKFTPVHLAAASDLIAIVTITPAGTENSLTLNVVEVLKGSNAFSKLTCELTASERAMQAMRKTLEQRTGDALLFLAHSGTVATSPVDSGILHAGANWFRLKNGSAEHWILTQRDDSLVGTWAGGHESLLRIIRYVLSDRAAIVPSKVEEQWKEPLHVAKIEGRVNSLIAYRGPGSTSLLIASEAGDRLFESRQGSSHYVDVTEARGLQSKSRCLAYADFDGDGRLDIASLTENTVSLWLCGSNAMFFRDAAKVLTNRCVNMVPFDAGLGGQSGLVIATDHQPILLTRKSKNELAENRLGASSSVAFPSLGVPGKGVVGDFDGDGIPDIIQPFSRDALFYRGTGRGRFDAPKLLGLSSSRTSPAAFAGDFNADGLLDLVVTGDAGCEIWLNRGKGRFEAVLAESGEPAYLTKPNSIGGVSCDINNDGIQDFLLTYSDRVPQIFFNRGFGVFGLASSLSLDDTAAFPDHAKGQQAGLSADLNGDGSQDLVVVRSDGELMVFYRQTPFPPAAAHIRLGSAVPFAGPVTTKAWSGNRCLGAWLVDAGALEALISLPQPGLIRLTWQFPGEAQVTRELMLDGPMTLLLGKDGALQGE